MKPDLCERCRTSELEVVKKRNIYDVKFQYARLFIKTRKLLDQHTVPVGLLNVLYNNLVHCHVRHNKTLHGCCSRNINVCGCFMMKWYKCVRALVKIVLVLIVPVPWVLRLYVYFTYEEEAALQKEELAGRFGLSSSFTGSLTLFLTPIHGLFLLTYSVLVVTLFVYRIAFKAMREMFNFIIRKCLRDMHAQFSKKVLAKVTRFFVLDPCQKHGQKGILISLGRLLFLIACLPVIAFYLVPSLNLSARLVIHLVFFLCSCCMCSCKVRHTFC